MEQATNIYRKLQKMRVDLQKTGICKSGHNDYGKYDYFELSDFLPQINEIQEKHDTVSLFSINSEYAELMILDCADTTQGIEFRIPMAELALKGANAIQNVGGLTTYCRRYLYMIAFEIAENDEFDPNESNEPQQPEVYYVDAVKIKVLKEKMDKKGVTDQQIFDRYKVNAFEEMTVQQFVNAMNGLDKTPDKEKPQVDIF